MLWAVTSYFNPLGYRRRLENYREFRRRLGVPLLAIELGFGGRFDLDENDADMVVRAAGGDVLWQKERLLNVGLSKLPAQCSAVACLDCDIFFAQAEWPAQALEQLGRCAIVQPFATVHHLRGDWRPGSDLPRAVRFSQPAVVRTVEQSGDARALLGTPIGRAPGLPSRGFAWVFRRELLARHGLFDGCIVGGGNRAMACAAYGCFDAVVRLHYMNALQQRHYEEWARPFFEDVRGRVGSLGGELYHLWHGREEDRRLTERHLALPDHAFDPYGDIALDESGAWRWSSDKPQLHAYLRDYFMARKEDG
jgi:hypothetical protein